MNENNIGNEGCKELTENKKYKILTIKVNFKEGIKQISLPIEFRKKICKVVNELFPNWNSIEYMFE